MPHDTAALKSLMTKQPTFSPSSEKIVLGESWPVSRLQFGWEG